MFRQGGAVLVAVVMMSSCVTKGTYEKLETEKNQEIAQLQTERSELEKQIAQLESERTELQLQKTSLEREQVELQTEVGLLGQQHKSLEQQQSDLQKQIESLQQQKAQLQTSSEDTQVQYDALLHDLAEEVKQGQLEVKQYKNMLTVDVPEQLFFDAGQASLKASGKKVLKKVGDTLKAYDGKVIRVVGHTDDASIAKTKKVFPSSWELSTARATTVVRYLQEKVGVPPERLIASGRAEYAPVDAIGAAAGHKQNRRIEITLIDQALVQEGTAPIAH
ncbi:MAG: OmpA family protein [Gammaproteobacteria bacterium]|nr:OmpA family protein [Gammaproteobacteria bacterium]